MNSQIGSALSSRVFSHKGGTSGIGILSDDKKGRAGFLSHSCREAVLSLTQSFRRSNQEYFGKGILLKDVYDFSRVRSHATERTLEKIQRFIPYIEKEHNVAIRRKTARRLVRCKKLL